MQSQADGARSAFERAARSTTFHALLDRLSDRSARYNRSFFIKHKRKLTTLRILRYSCGHRKGVNNPILSMLPGAKFDDVQAVLSSCSRRNY